MAPLVEAFKLNVDGAAKGNPGLDGIGVPRNQKGHILLPFSNFIEVKDSNEA